MFYLRDDVEAACGVVVRSGCGGFRCEYLNTLTIEYVDPPGRIRDNAVRIVQLPLFFAGAPPQAEKLLIPHGFYMGCVLETLTL